MTITKDSAHWRVEITSTLTGLSTPRAWFVARWQAEQFVKMNPSPHYRVVNERPAPIELRFDEHVDQDATDLTTF